MLKKAVILSVILIVWISSADAYVPDIGQSGCVEASGTCGTYGGGSGGGGGGYVEPPPSYQRAYPQSVEYHKQYNYDYTLGCLQASSESAMRAGTPRDIGGIKQACIDIINRKRQDVWNVYNFCYNSECDRIGYYGSDCAWYCEAYSNIYKAWADDSVFYAAMDRWEADYRKSLPPEPTCYDNIKNQGETKTDCGGPCRACPSCSDRIQNQGETGIDCGGPCSICQTCNDGIKNQGENDIDCGGPCPVCITCSDNIQNQGETGIDCGGPCEPCPTCDDHIKNQGEEKVDCGGPCEPCPSCSDKIKNQGEERADCGGPCKACLPIITIDDMSREEKNYLSFLWFMHAKYFEDEDQERVEQFEAAILRFYKETSEKYGGDPAAYDIMNYFKQLEAGQKAMSKGEKATRIAVAKRGYNDLLIDEYKYERGQKELKQAVDDKKEEIKAQYGRILLFDPNNIQANKALADIYDKEGKESEAKVLYKKFLENAAKDSKTYKEVEARLKTYKKEASDGLNLPAAPNTITSKVMRSVSEDFTAALDKANLELYNQKMNIKIMLEGATLSKERKAIWDRLNEIESLFSFSPKVEELTGVESEQES